MRRDREKKPIKRRSVKAWERYRAKMAIGPGETQAGPSPFDRLQWVVFKVKIKAGGFAQLPEGELAMAIFEQAVMDLFDRKYSVDAKQFLRGDLVCLQRLGVDPDWVRKLLKEQGVWDIVSAK